MIWLLVAIILGAIVYTITVIGEYNSFQQDIQQRIEALEEKCEGLQVKIGTETDLLHEGERRFRELKERLTILSPEVFSTEQDLKKLRERAEQLETEKYKQDFNRSRGT